MSEKLHVRLKEEVLLDSLIRKASFQFGGLDREIYWCFKGPVRPQENHGLGEAAAIAVLPFAMAHKVPLHIHCSVDRTLLENLEEYQDAWSAWRPDLFNKVDISADEEVSPDPNHNEDAVLLFSGGVDSVYSLVTHTQKKLGRRSREIKTGLFIHGFDIPLTEEKGFAQAKKNAGEILSGFSVPLSTVETNWRSFCPDWEMMFGAGMAAALNHFRGVAGRGLLSADLNYKNGFWPWGDNPITNPLLGSVGFPIETTGQDKTRTERCKEIAVYPFIRDLVRVCWEEVHGANCGRCEKCKRTYLNFRACGWETVPAIPVSPSIREVVDIVCRNTTQLSYLIDIAEYTNPGLPSDIKKKLLKTIRRQKRRLAVKK